MTDTDDARLVALIDNQLDETARSALATRLVVEPELRARFALLAAGGLPFSRAFDSVLVEAPLASLQAKIDAVAPGGATSRPRLGAVRWIGVAAAAMALLLLGWGIGRYAPSPSAPASIALQDDDWRRAVAQYVSLYTAQTFANDADAGANEAALAQLSQNLGVAVTQASVALPDLMLRRADMLAYDGAPLGQIAYLDAGEPVVFCIIRNNEKDAPVTIETRDELAIASWAHGGRGYLVAGRRPAQRIAALAETLLPRF